MTAVAAAVAAAGACVVLVVAWAFEWSLPLLRDLLDLLGLLASIKAMTRRVRGGRSWGVVDIFEATAKRLPDKHVMVMADESGKTCTFREMDLRSNQVARWALESGCEPGCTVAVLMPNCIDFVTLWLGIAKVGAVSALLNTNIAGPPLVHAIKTALSESSCKMLLLGRELEPLVARHDVRDALIEAGVWVAVFDTVRGLAVGAGAGVGGSGNEDDGGGGGGGGGGDAGTWSGVQTTCNLEIAAMPSHAVDAAYRADVHWDSVLFFLYTSGTTGLPKASKINQLRFWSAGSTIHRLCHLSAADRLYCALPLYHASGGMMGVSACFQTGATMVLRPRFSVSQFAHDIAVHKCTVMQYIGELARYLCTAHPTPLDGSWPIKYAIGNGLRPEVWEKFARRYNVGKVVEFYAATEGNTVRHTLPHPRRFITTTTTTTTRTSSTTRGGSARSAWCRGLRRSSTR